MNTQKEIKSSKVLNAEDIFFMNFGDRIPRKHKKKHVTYVLLCLRKQNENGTRHLFFKMIREGEEIWRAHSYRTAHGGSWKCDSSFTPIPDLHSCSEELNVIEQHKNELLEKLIGRNRLRFVIEKMPDGKSILYFTGVLCGKYRKEALAACK